MWDLFMVCQAWMLLNCILCKETCYALLQPSQEVRSARSTSGSLPDLSRPSQRLRPGRKDRTSIRVVVNVGKSELEMLRTSNAQTGALAPLARFTIGNLWVVFR